jgi:hypothetical protein
VFVVVVVVTTNLCPVSVATVGSNKGNNRVLALQPVLELELAETTTQAAVLCEQSILPSDV